MATRTRLTMAYFKDIKALKLSRTKAAHAKAALKKAKAAHGKARKETLRLLRLMHKQIKTFKSARAAWTKAKKTHVRSKKQWRHYKADWAAARNHVAQAKKILKAAEKKAKKALLAKNAGKKKERSDFGKIKPALTKVTKSKRALASTHNKWKAARHV